jgi:beta-glucosidase
MQRVALLASAWLIVQSSASLAQRQQASARDIEGRVESLLARLTPEEKIDLIAGRTGFDIPGIERLGLPTLWASDSPFGVRANGPSTLYTGGIGLAATFNPELARLVGVQLGRDARARGRQYSLGPGVNIYRSPLNGRNFEYYGEDPFLAGRIAVGFINGVQSQGVSSTIKHFLGNNSEFGRNTTDSRIDERALREIYLPAFEAAVKDAHTGAIMGSYNRTNGLFMTENKRLIRDVLKGEWGFSGVYMSDWFATHDPIAAANAGTDLEMPEPRNFNRAMLLPAVHQEKVSQATIDDKVRRLLRNQVRFGWMDGRIHDDTTPNYNRDGARMALQSAREAIVLLKNTSGVLPLDRAKVKSIAVIGPNSHPAVTLGGGSAAIPTYHAVSTLEGIASHVGPTAIVQHVRGIPSLGGVAATTNFSTAASGAEKKPGITTQVFYSSEPTGTPAATRVDEHVSVGAPLDLGTVIREDWPVYPRGYQGPSGPVSHRFTGYYNAAKAGTYDIVVQQGAFADAGYRLFVDNKLVVDRWKMSPSVVETISAPFSSGAHKIVLEHHSENNNFGSPFIRLGIVRQGDWVDPAAVAAARRADVVVLAVGYDPQTETENWDRTFRLPPGQDELIKAIVAANPRTIVVVNSGGSFDMNEWADRAPAIVEAWYPGQEGGTALADIIFGDVNPSGHLPATFEKRWEDNPVYSSYYPDSGTNRIHYKEGVFVGYRGYESRNIAPRFPFGYGLSYTTFRYANLAIAPRDSGGVRSWTAAFDVTNTGTRAGAAVAQVYVHQARSPIPRPPKELKGISKVLLEPGQTRRVSVPLDFRSLAYYDTTKSVWRADAGAYDILVGSSSADIALRGQLTLAETRTAKP